MKQFRLVCLILATLASLVSPFCQPAAFAADPLPAPRLTLAGRIGGSSLAVAVADGYAFVGQSAEFTVVDVRDAQHPQRVAYLPLAANDLALQGGYAYVTNKEGLAAVDISEVAAPRRTSFQATPQALTALAAAEDYVYAIAPRAGLFVYDLSRPDQPQPIGFLHQPGAEGVAVQGEYVYLATADGLQVVSVADESWPVLVAATALPALEAVAVAGRYAYLTAMTGALLIADIANPTAPVLVSALSLPSYTKGLQVMGDMAYVANGANGLAAVDVRDRSHPHLIGVQKVGALVTDVFAAGESVWATDVYDGGLHILRRSPPSGLAEIAVYRVPGVAQDVAAGGQYAYLVAGKEAGIAIVDLADPGCLEGTGFFSTPARTVVLSVQDDRLYALDAHNTLQVLSLSDPTHPASLGTRSLAAGTQVIAADGSLFFVNDASGMLHVFDAASAGLPQEAGMLAASGAIYDAAMTGSYLLAAAGAQGVWVARDAGPNTPAAAERVTLPGAAQFVAAAGARGYVLTSAGDLFTLDLSTPGAANVVGQIALGVNAKEVAADSRHVYIAAGDDGVYVLDAAAAGDGGAARVLVYDTPGTALHVEPVGGNILVADSFAGLLLLRLEN